MSAWPRHILLIVVLLLGGVLRAGDYEHNVGMVTGADAEIRLTVPGGQMPQSGFLPLRVRINNRSNRERTWRLELGSGPPGGRVLTSDRTLVVPAASTREFYAFAPLAAKTNSYSGAIHGRVDGPQVEQNDFDFRLAMSWGLATAPVAVEPALEARLNDLVSDQGPPAATVPAGVAARVRAIRSGAPARVVQKNIAVIDPALWPADWRLWSSFATVLLEQSTWERLDVSRRQALLDWVALGGRLVRVNGPESRQHYGAGLIVTLAGAMFTVPGDIGEFVLNEAHRPGETQGQLVNAEFWTLNPREWQPGVQHRWLTGYIIAFGLLIGPINLFYFAPTGRRHRLFLSVPIISFAAAALLFGCITVSDGFGGAGTRRALVLLQPAQNRAVVFQRQISRTGLLTGRSFALPADALMSMQADENPATGVDTQMWREEDVASGSWFTSRSTQQQSLSRLVPTRERVELVGAPGSDPVIQSTVSGTLREFIFMDQAGMMWTAAEVPPGSRVPLVAVTGTMATTGLREILYKYVPTPGLARGTFYALGGSGGLIPTLPSIRWRDDRVLYTGRLGGEGEATP